MDIYKIIKEEILNFNKLDLSNHDSVIRWMMDNAPEQVFKDNDEESGDNEEEDSDDTDKLNYDYRDPMTGMELDDLIYSYMKNYKNIICKPEIEIYRLVKLKNINELNLKNIGEYWSFEEDGVGDYGVSGENTNNPSFILTGITNINNISWDDGFYSFLCYGPSQFECYINKGSEITITKINGEELNNPIKGIS